jgi:hypothetical protein
MKIKEFPKNTTAKDLIRELYKIVPNYTKDMALGFMTSSLKPIKNVLLFRIIAVKSGSIRLP